MLGMLPVYLNARTGNIFLASSPKFLIEPKVIYEMSPCEEGHTYPDLHHDCGIMTSLDLEEMQRFVYPRDSYNFEAVPAIAIFQVTGRTVFDKEAKVLRSKGIYYFGIINDDLAAIAYHKQYRAAMYFSHARYEGSIISFWRLLLMMNQCKFDLLKLEGKIYEGYSPSSRVPSILDEE